MQGIKQNTEGVAVTFFRLWLLKEKKIIKTKKKKCKKTKILKDGFGDMHSQTSLYSHDEEISLCLKRTLRENLKKGRKGTMFSFLKAFN